MPRSNAASVPAPGHATSKPGTRPCYTAGCRQPECREANRIYNDCRRKGIPPPPEIMGGYTTANSTQGGKDAAGNPVLHFGRIRIKVRSSRGWSQHAACKPLPGASPADIRYIVSLFHPERNSTTPEIDMAKEICAGCTVRYDCLAWALTNQTQHDSKGIWGGMTEEERRLPLRVLRSGEVDLNDADLESWLRSRYPEPITVKVRAARKKKGQDMWDATPGQDDE